MTTCWLTIRGAVAEYERTLIAERMRRGRLQKYQMGQMLPWTHPPCGYRMDPDHPRAPEGVRLDERRRQQWWLKSLLGIWNQGKVWQGWRRD
jgi:DNA invertase Pin-like site-specific DNA recombinase